MDKKKHIHVACAIIKRCDGFIFAAQRKANMDSALKWEFPGGKIEPGESAEACLRREVMEELEIELHILKSLSTNTYAYPDFMITLYPFVCQIAAGTITLHDHVASCWKSPETLDELDWAAADIPVLASYLIHK